MPGNLARGVDTPYERLSISTSCLMSAAGQGGSVINIPAELVDDPRRGAWRELHHVAEEVIAVKLVPGLHTTLEQHQEQRASAEATWAFLDCIGWTEPAELRSEHASPVDSQLHLPSHERALRCALRRACDDAESALVEVRVDAGDVGYGAMTAHIQRLSEVAYSLRSPADVRGV